MKRGLFLFPCLILSTVAFAYELGPDGKAAQALLENILSGNTVQVFGALDKSLGTPETLSKGLGQIRAVFKNTAISRQYFSEGSTVFKTFRGGKFYRGVLRVEAADHQSYLLDYHCQVIDDKCVFDDFHLNLVTEEQKNNAQFQFTGRCLGDYVMMLYGLLIVLFTIFSAAMVWKSGLKRKILWTLVCLFSVIQFSVTWTPGEFWAIPIPDVKLFKFLLFGAAFAKVGTYNPFVLSVGIPVGAFLFWRARSKSEKTVKTRKSKS